MQIGRTRLTQEERQRRYALDAACTADPRVTSAGLAWFGQKTGLIWGRGSPDEPYPNLPILPTPYSAPGQAHLVRVEFQVLCPGGFWGGGKFYRFSPDVTNGDTHGTSGHPIGSNALNGHLLARVEHQTPPLTFLPSGNHKETLRLHIISLPQAPIVLGHSWLQLHNPHIYWSTGIVVSWSTPCHARCLRAAPTSAPPPHHPQLSRLDTSLIPPEYHDLLEVFREDRARSLPPHRPYDCAIDLQPGTPLSSSRLYNLSKPEREAMETYIQESLATGIFRPSSSPPLGAGFFFVAKKDKTLCPCIDFRGLNNITCKKVVFDTDSEFDIVY